MLLGIPLDQLVAQVRGHRVEIFLDPLVHAVALDDHLGEIVVEDVTHHADGDIRLALQQLRTLAVQIQVALLANLVPLPAQRLEILLDGLLGSAFSCGTDDHTHILRSDLRNDGLQASTLTVRQLAADARHTAGRYEDKETACERDLRGQTRTLVTDRVLGDLHKHRVA